MTDRKALSKAEREKVLIKIRALLELGDKDKNPSEAEAAAAAAKAEELMQRHDVEFADVLTLELKDGSGVSSEWVYANVNKGAAKTISNWAHWLASTTARVYDCHCALSDGEVQVTATRSEKCVGIRFYGYDLDVKVCAWMYVYLFQSVLRMSMVHLMQLQQVGMTGNAVKRKLSTFREGTTQRVCHRLRDIIAARDAEMRTASSNVGTSLVVLKRDAIEAKFGAFEYEQQKYELDVSNLGSWYAGVQAGDRIDLNVRGVGEGQAARKLSRG